MTAAAPQYRILQTSPTTWELDRVSTVGGWRLVGFFASQADAQNQMTALIAVDAWTAPPPQYFDSGGNATASPVQP